MRTPSKPKTPQFSFPTNEEDGVNPMLFGIAGASKVRRIAYSTLYGYLTLIAYSILNGYSNFIAYSNLFAYSSLNVYLILVAY